MPTTQALADRISLISVSSTMKVAADADRLRREGNDVVDFGAGERVASLLRLRLPAAPVLSRSIRLTSPWRVRPSRRRSSMPSATPPCTARQEACRRRKYWPAWPAGSRAPGPAGPRDHWAA